MAERRSRIQGKGSSRLVGIDWGGSSSDEYDVRSSSNDSNFPTRKRVHVSTDNETSPSVLSAFGEPGFGNFDNYHPRRQTSLLGSPARGSARIARDSASMSSHELEPTPAKKRSAPDQLSHSSSFFDPPTAPTPAKKTPVPDRLSHSTSFFGSQDRQGHSQGTPRSQQREATPRRTPRKQDRQGHSRGTPRSQQREASPRHAPKKQDSAGSLLTVASSVHDKLSPAPIKATSLKHGQREHPEGSQASTAGPSRPLSSNHAIKPVKRGPGRPRKDASSKKAPETPRSHASVSSRKASSKHLQNKSRKARRPVGYRALREIVRLQRGTNLLIPRLPFGRLVKELLWSIAGSPLRMQSVALEGLHEAAEIVLVSVFSLSYQFSHFTKRVTLMQRDMALTMRILEQAYHLHQCLS